MRRLHLLTTLFLLLSAGTAHALEGRGYAGGALGMFLPIESSVTGNFVPRDSKLTFNPGLAVLLQGGYQFANGFRAEGEASYRRLSSEELHTNGRIAPADSSITSYSLMANFYYDFLTRTVISPYLGAGVGVAQTRFGEASSNGNVLWTKDRDVTVAYQGIAGFACRISDDTSLDFVYHHFAIPRLHFKTLSAEFRGINLFVGIRHWF